MHPQHPYSLPTSQKLGRDRNHLRALILPVPVVGCDAVAPDAPMSSPPAPVAIRCLCHVVISRAWAAAFLLAYFPAGDSLPSPAMPLSAIASGTGKIPSANSRNLLMPSSVSGDEGGGLYCRIFAHKFSPLGRIHNTTPQGSYTLHGYLLNCSIS